MEHCTGKTRQAAMLLPNDERVAICLTDESYIKACLDCQWVGTEFDPQPHPRTSVSTIVVGVLP